jgi:molecular chaperone HscA
MGRMPVPQQGFAIGVDLGTSNTVAVVRWPDGRTRPLLVDGVPVMPSGVYADESGQLLVGRDAQRLAGLDPSRFEPNPKRRIDEPGVLLGNREVATVDMLGAVLAAVARAAVEAVGFLPPAVLTYPAAWGPRRRDVLAYAASRAGWPPVRLLPEPVAAARYFADVLRRPVPVGACLAVFDFGGGTLDIAVVRNENGQFNVLGSGGIEDLGGLDVDAALVEHLGGVLSSSAPEVWQALNQPDTTSRRRDRRLFWEDVRGAKEMLSRTTVAPITIPGRDQAIHLTREELERVAEPLLRRAVWETGAVIHRCGLRPDQLAGLFLVGGSSRLPLAARLLHAELGIAPTVLEQPELPVAEGALAELVPPQATPAMEPQTAQAVYPVTAAVPVSAHPAAPHSVSPPYGPTFPVSPSPVSPPPQSYSPPAPPPQSWLKRPITWIAAAAAVGVLALVAVLALHQFSRGVSAANFSTLRAGSSVPIADSKNADYPVTATVGNRTYYGWTANGKFHLGAMDLAKGENVWGPIDIDNKATSWTLSALPDRVVAISAPSGDPGALYVFGNDGKQHFQVPMGGQDSAYFFKDNLVLYQDQTRQMLGLDWADGHKKWTRDNPKSGSYNDTSLAGESTLGDFAGPGAPSGRPLFYADGDSQRIVQTGADKKLYLVDGTNGKTIRQWNAVDSSSVKYFASEGKYYIGWGTPYQIQAYDLDKQDEPQTIFSSPDSKRSLVTIAPCGTDRVCALDETSDNTSTEVVAFDVKSHKQLWRKPAGGTDTLVSLGDQVLATTTQSSSSVASFLYSADGKKQLLGADDQKTIGVRVNAHSLLFVSGGLGSTSSGDLSLVGVTTQDGKRTALGPLQGVVGSSCSWNEKDVVCATADKIQVWHFTS